MVDRGFGLELEETYGDTTVTKSEFDPNFWNQADEVDFKLNDTPITKSGGSRMNKRARAGVMKPTGSTSADADLQQLTWYFLAYLDNYICTEGDTPATGHTQTYIHEFYGGEGKELPSFRGIAVYDMLKKYLYGLLCDGMSLEVSDESMTVGADWIYKTEKAGIIGQSGETFTRPDDLDDDLVSGLVEDARCEESVLSFLSGYGFLVHQQGEYVSAFVLGVELLHVVADALEHAEVVVPNHVRTPLPALNMGEEGSVGGHLYDVGIALDTCHEGSLVE